MDAQTLSTAVFVWCDTKNHNNNLPKIKKIVDYCKLYPIRELVDNAWVG